MAMCSFELGTAVSEPIAKDDGLRLGVNKNQTIDLEGRTEQDASDVVDKIDTVENDDRNVRDALDDAIKNYTTGHDDVDERDASDGSIKSRAAGYDGMNARNIIEVAVEDHTNENNYLESANEQADNNDDRKATYLEQQISAELCVQWDTFYDRKGVREEQLHQGSEESRVQSRV